MERRERTLQSFYCMAEPIAFQAIDSKIFSSNKETGRKSNQGDQRGGGRERERETDYCDVMLRHFTTFFK